MVAGLVTVFGTAAYLGITNRKDSVGQILTFLVPAGIVMAVLGGLMRESSDESLRRKLLDSGIPARATVIEAETLGFNKGSGQTRIKLTLEMQPEGRAAYRAECTFYVAVADAKLLYPPGGVVKAFYDPEDPVRVAVADVELRSK